ncbi:NUDIX hydrolase domain-like protein [Paraphysoderma sedebokerense]|nr:NUDIX hydrolase domain-like protein [Paraphysoderma sedebokerense]
MSVDTHSRANQVYMDGFRLVAGCVPISKSGTHVLLISSRANPSQWILPKGGCESTDDNYDAAAERECWEEAGVKGKITSFIGKFEHIPKSKPHKKQLCYFYEMVVESEFEDFPELLERKRQWFPYTEALKVVKKKHMLEALTTCSLAKSQSSPNSAFVSSTIIPVYTH